MLAIERHSGAWIRDVTEESLESTASRWIRSDSRKNVQYYSSTHYNLLHWRWRSGKLESLDFGKAATEPISPCSAKFDNIEVA